MKSLFTALCVFVVTVCAAQANKFESGDFGMRYGVAFNGAAVQGLTFSGMATANIEVGCGINVQYTTSSITNNTATEVQIYTNGTYSEAPAQYTQQSHSKTLNTSFTPFVFYHFKIKNNLDIYAGPNLIIGTGAHTMASYSSSTTQAEDYYSNTFSKTIYPLGYQIGAGLNIGGQYFFYKRLALGVQATLGVTYSSTNGNEKSVYQITNTGANNQNTPTDFVSVIFAPYTNHSLNLTTASSIGVNLTFYLAQKAKTGKAAKVL